MNLEGRLAVSYVITRRPLSGEVRDDPAMLPRYVAGAVSTKELEHMLHEAGFRDACIRIIGESGEFTEE